jgi:hypothetical protein
MSQSSSLLPNSQCPRVSIRSNQVVRVSSAVVLWSLCLTVAWGQSQTPTTGTISATVLDSHDNPISGLTVMLRSVGQQAQRIRQMLPTDENGQLVASDCPFGTYVISATHNEVPGTPMNPTIRGNSIVTAVLLSRSFPTASLTLKFGRNTIILSGTVKDAVTGGTVVARLDIKSAASGQSLFSGAVPSEYRIVVPRGDDLSLQVSSPGYKSWYYPGAIMRSNGHPLTLQMGASKHLDIELKPGAN